MAHEPSEPPDLSGKLYSRLQQSNDLEAQDGHSNEIKQTYNPNSTFQFSKEESKAPFRCFELTKGFQRALVATATAAIILLLVCYLLKPAENKVKGCAYRDLSGVTKDEPCARIDYPCIQHRDGGRAECPASLLHYNCKSRRTEERQIMYCPYGPKGCTDPHDDCQPCCGSDGCGKSVPKCSEAFPKDTGIKEPTVKVKVLMKASNRETIGHDHQAPTVHITFKGENCTLNNLPEMAASATRDLEWIVLDSFETLGNCSNLDVREPLVQEREKAKEDVAFQMKLPLNSPVTISSVKLMDNKDDGRCWKSTWTGEKWNQQNNVYIQGSPVKYYQMC